jgi:hypothetical protein
MKTKKMARRSGCLYPAWFSRQRDQFSPQTSRPPDVMFSPEVAWPPPWSPHRLPAPAPAAALPVNTSVLGLYGPVLRERLEKGSQPFPLGHDCPERRDYLHLPGPRTGLGRQPAWRSLRQERSQFAAVKAGTTA